MGPRGRHATALHTVPKERGCGGAGYRRAFPEDVFLWAGGAPCQSPIDRIASASGLAVLTHSCHWARAVWRCSMGTPCQRRVSADRCIDREFARGGLRSCGWGGGSQRTRTLEREGRPAHFAHVRRSEIVEFGRGARMQLPSDRFHMLVEILA